MHLLGGFLSAGEGGKARGCGSVVQEQAPSMLSCMSNEPAALFSLSCLIYFPHERVVGLWRPV